jgi:hypothetical protein
VAGGLAAGLTVPVVMATCVCDGGGQGAQCGSCPAKEGTGVRCDVHAQWPSAQCSVPNAAQAMQLLRLVAAALPVGASPPASLPPCRSAPNCCAAVW